MLHGETRQNSAREGITVALLGRRHLDTTVGFTTIIQMYISCIMAPGAWVKPRRIRWRYSDKAPCYTPMRVGITVALLGLCDLGIIRITKIDISYILTDTRLGHSHRLGDLLRFWALATSGLQPLCKCILVVSLLAVD